MPKPRLRSALNIDIDPRLLERVQERAKHDGLGVRVVVENALSLYLNGHGLPAALEASLAKTQADVGLLAAQIEPIAAFLATVRYGTAPSPRSRSRTSEDEDF